MSRRTITTAAGRRRLRKAVLGAGIAGALVFSTAQAAQAVGTPTPTPTASSPTPTATATPLPTPSAATPTPTPTPTPAVTAGALTIKTKTAGTGTNFGGTYRVQQGGASVPADGRIVDLQRKTPAGWATVTSDAADANGNLVYGTVRSNFVQTWRLAARTAPTDPAYAVSAEFKVAQNGKATSALTWATSGLRTGKQVTFAGLLTYRSWWITSGPDTGAQSFVEPQSARVYLQYLSGTTWRNKTSKPIDNTEAAGFNVRFDVSTVSSKARTWRLYYPGSSTRTAVTSKTLTR